MANQVLNDDDARPEDLPPSYARALEDLPPRYATHFNPLQHARGRHARIPIFDDFDTVLSDISRTSAGMRRALRDLEALNPGRVRHSVDIRRPVSSETVQVLSRIQELERKARTYACKYEQLWAKAERLSQECEDDNEQDSDGAAVSGVGSSSEATTGGLVTLSCEEVLAGMGD